MGFVCSCHEKRVSKPTGVNGSTTDIWSGVRIIKSPLFIYSSDENRIICRPSILTTNRQGHEKMLSSSSSAMQISTPITNHVVSCMNKVKSERSHTVNDISSVVGSFQYQTYVNGSGCDLDVGQNPYLNVWNGDCSVIASVLPNQREPSTIEKDDRLDMELESPPTPVGCYTPAKVHSLNWLNNQRSVTNKLEQTSGNVVVEQVLNISKSTRLADMDEKTHDEFSSYLTSPQCWATYETVDTWSDNERSLRLTETPVHERTLLKKFELWPKGRKRSKDILQFAQQEVSRTQRVASKLDDKLVKVDSLANSGSNRFIFSPSNLQKSENIDKLEEEIDNIIKNIRNLRRRSVSMLISDKDLNSSADDLTTLYLDVEREISSLQKRLLLLEKQKENMISDLQMNMLQFGETLKAERSIMVVNEVCSMNTDMQGNSCSRTNEIGNQSDSIKTYEL